MKHEDDKVIAFERAGLLFIFNFHSTKSFTDYRIGIDDSGVYKCILSSDDKEFGGYDRIDKNTKHFTDPLGYCNRKNFVQVSFFKFRSLIENNFMLFFLFNSISALLTITFSSNTCQSRLNIYIFFLKKKVKFVNTMKCVTKNKLYCYCH